MFLPVQKVVTEHRYDLLQAGYGARKSKVGGSAALKSASLAG